MKIPTVIKDGPVGPDSSFDIPQIIADAFTEKFGECAYQVAQAQQNVARDDTKGAWTNVVALLKHRE